MMMILLNTIDGMNIYPLFSYSLIWALFCNFKDWGSHTLQVKEFFDTMQYRGDASNE
jgi:hypothetical protein